MRWDLQTLFKRHSQELLRFIRRTGVADDAAPDLLHDAFVRLAANSDAQDVPIANPRAYLFQVSRNLATDHMRAAAVRQRYAVSEIPEDIAAPAVLSEATVDFRRQVGRLEDAIGDLPARQREVFILHKFDGMSHSEIAAHLGISRSMVEKHMIKALTQLRTNLGDLFD